MRQPVCLIIPPSAFLLDERVFMSLGILKVDVLGLGMAQTPDADAHAASSPRSTSRAKVGGWTPAIETATMCISHLWPSVSRNDPAVGRRRVCVMVTYRA